MINLMTGCVLEERFIEAVDRLNQKYIGNDIVINEVYGSMQKEVSDLASARPDFRISDISWEDFEKLISLANKYDIEFNYSLNAPYTGAHKEFEENKGTMIESVRRLIDMGIARLTIASPLVLELIQKNFVIPIELSTILHINSVHQIEYYSEHHPIVDCICLNLYRNRDISFLQKFNIESNKHNIRTQILATEFCNVGGAPCLGVYRAQCYELHAENMDKKEAGMFSNYPMGRCIHNRAGDKSAWLKSRVVYPNELEEYAELTGINNYKITCRTAPNDFALELIEHYMAKQYNGGLLGLWMHLETIKFSGEKWDKVQEKTSGALDISCEKLSSRLVDSKRFYDKWFENPDFRCDEVACSDCRWCYDWADIALE